MVREGGEGSYWWLCGCSHIRFPFCTTCITVLVMDDDDDDDAVMTYDCFTPHCRCMGDGGLTIVLHLHSLLCRGFGVFTCHVAFMDHCVGPLALSLGSSTSATQVHFTR